MSPSEESGPSPSSSKKRVGLLGAGYIASYHAKALALLPSVQVVAVCDRSLPRALACASAFGIPHTYGSIREMLQAHALDAVHVLLPPERHFDAAVELLDARVNVFLEKPMCIDPAQAELLARKADSLGLRIGVGHNFLFAEPYERLRNDLRSGVLGRLDAVTITWNKHLGQLGAGPFDVWMFQKPENILLEIGPHSVGCMLDLVGRPATMQVRASQRTVLPTGNPFFRRWRMDAEVDGIAVDLRFSFGPGFTEHSVHVRGHLAAATVDFERNTYVLSRHSSSEIDFDRMQMSHAEARQAVFQTWGTVADYVLAKAKLSRKAGNPYGFGILKAASAFYDGLSTEPDRRISSAFGRDVVTVCRDIGLAGIASEPAAAGHAQATPAEARGSAAPSSVRATAPVLVLGATGFIGRELVRQYIAQGRPVRALVRGAGRLPADLRRSCLEIVEGDLGKPADVDRALAGVDCVCHLARANVKTWAEYQEQEIGMTELVAERSLVAGVKRFVYTGTIDSYYAGAAKERITEKTPLDPKIEGRNLYARAKAISEERLTRMHRERGLPLVIVRPGIVIGRGGSPFHWGVGMWRHGTVCQIWGEGHNKLPIVLVDDVARGIIAAGDVPAIEGESFNLVGDVALTANEYLDELDRAGRMKIQRYATPIRQFFAGDLFKWLVKVAVRFPERRRPTLRDWQSRTQLAQFDCTLAKSKLGWTPESDRGEVIRRGIDVPLTEVLGE
jgi:predicted dehydrogenase/nucleoside-diphosphate-sugar epimerase